MAAGFLRGASGCGVKRVFKGCHVEKENEERKDRRKGKRIVGVVDMTNYFN
jgi:hypothetical protein